MELHDLEDRIRKIRMARKTFGPSPDGSARSDFRRCANFLLFAVPLEIFSALWLAIPAYLVWDKIILAYLAVPRITFVQMWLVCYVLQLVRVATATGLSYVSQRTAIKIGVPPTEGLWDDQEKNS